MASQNSTDGLISSSKDLSAFTRLLLEESDRKLERTASLLLEGAPALNSARLLLATGQRLPEATMVKTDSGDDEAGR
jgi:hypothetical protein